MLIDAPEAANISCALVRWLLPVVQDRDHAAVGALDPIETAFEDLLEIVCPASVFFLKYAVLVVAEGTDPNVRGCRGIL